MQKMILGIFSDRTKAEDAINKLEEEGYNPKDISILMKNREEGEEFAEDTNTNVAGGAISGATTGAVVGGLAGLLAATVLPGIGAFLIGGPVAAALGLTGAAATTVSGAATGALAGGLIGALTGMGVSEDDARIYEQEINQGGILVMVPLREGYESEAKDILSSYDATQLRTVDITLPSSRDSGRSKNLYSESSYPHYGTAGGQSTTRNKEEDNDI